MMIDTPEVQEKVTLWSAILGIAVAVSTYILGYHLFSYGIAFGMGLMVLNYRVIGFILDKIFSLTLPDIAKFFGLISYHVRFWIIIIIMFFVVTRFDTSFGVGTFVGFIIPKIMMGIFVAKQNGAEWWNDAKVIQEEQKIEEFKPFNPFEIDPVEEEIKKHLKL